MNKQISNVLSLTNLSLGFISLFFIFNELYLYASYLMLLAVLVDMSDGAVARILKIDSDLGKNLDNLCDVFSFIFVPAIFSYIMFIHGLPTIFEYGFLVLILVFVASGIYRTARINVTHSPGFLNGLPTTFNGIVFPVLYITNFFSFYIISGWLILSSVLMLSKFKIKRLSFKKKKKMVEIKDDSVEEEKENNNIVPLPMFGD